MNTIEVHQKITKKILDVAENKTSVSKTRIAVRSASPNERTGRCLFDLDSVDFSKADIVVAAVLNGDRSAGQYYVVPTSIAPVKLLLRPASENSKWYPYYCKDASLAEMITKMSKYKGPSPELMARFG